MLELIQYRYDLKHQNFNHIFCTLNILPLLIYNALIFVASKIYFFKVTCNSNFWQKYENMDEFLRK